MKKAKVRTKKRPRRSSVLLKSLLWTDPTILFDGNDVIGAKPVHEALAGHRKAQKPTGASQRERSNGDYYTVSELAQEWGLSTDKIRELFRSEAGVIKLTDEKAKNKRKRQYVTLRIPPDVADRVKRSRS
jgi:hypothetical protein